jgi:hypothetical protein
MTPGCSDANTPGLVALGLRTSDGSRLELYLKDLSGRGVDADACGGLTEALSSSCFHLAGQQLAHLDHG